MPESIGERPGTPLDAREDAFPNTPMDTPWVTASAIGQATYCPYQLYLARAGADRDTTSAEALASGTTAHERWNDDRRADAARPLVALLRAALALALLAALALTVVLLVGGIDPS